MRVPEIVHISCPLSLLGYLSWLQCTFRKLCLFLENIFKFTSKTSIISGCCSCFPLSISPSKQMIPNWFSFALVLSVSLFLPQPTMRRFLKITWLLTSRNQTQEGSSLLLFGDLIDCFSIKELQDAFRSHLKVVLGFCTHSPPPMQRIKGVLYFAHMVITLKLSVVTLCLQSGARAS